MTQAEFFAKTQTDNLLRMRQWSTIWYPRFEGDKAFKNNYTDNYEYWLDHKLLREELSKRPHRIRAKDRRKPKHLKTNK